MKLVLIEADEMKRVLLDNNLGTPKTCQRLSNGAYGTTYKVTVKEPERPQLIVQLRFHGDVLSMNALQDYIRATVSQGLPVPRTYPIKSCDRSDGLQLQVTEFVPGTMANGIFKHLSIQDGIPIARQMARAFAALWELPVFKLNDAIGEAVASILDKPDSDGKLVIKVGPVRQDGVGGLFDSVSNFLRAWILHRFEKLEAQQGIDEYKAMLLPSIRSFVQTKLESRLPKGLDEIPVVLMHADLGLHNVLVSESPLFEIAAVIDWEFVSCLPFLWVVPRLIEPILREDLGDEKGAPLEAVQLLREVFWNEIPAWRDIMASQEEQTFLEWYEFGLYMKANPYMNFNAPVEERMAFRERNISTVRCFLDVWGPEGSSL
ncbi:Putative protein of unknown function [Podospora comata]|uniref:Aminoglycoside phosphotransferase domain-containing protein n=1 Tax=Podospora comata TaxID=48703 RepID=A0ABY6S8Q7_PODCO|nr:Putative protein of unknown function [Podospora comata]